MSIHINYGIKTLSWTLVFLLLGSVCQADILFEGYYKLLIGEKHAGYVVQRYDFDPKSKSFKSIYFIQSDPSIAKITESLTATANELYQPLSYQYTSSAHGKIKTIDAKFEGLDAKFSISDDGKRATKATKKIKSGTFLSTFLGYLMLSKGVSTNRKFSYNALAEEDGEVYSGEAYVKSEEKINGVQSYRILHTFRGTKFVSEMSTKGEVLGTHSPLQGIKTELVKTPAEAIASFPFPEKSIKILFGNIPSGKKNHLWPEPKQIEQSTAPKAKTTTDPKKKSAQ